MWWVHLIIAVLLVTTTNCVYRHFGFSLFVMTCCMPLILGPQYFFGQAYSKSPTFFQAWVFQLAILSMTSLAASTLLFKDTITTVNWIGLALALVGGVLVVM